jgi:hypothetical protein
MKRYLLFSLLLLSGFFASSQSVNVDNYTGKGFVTVPLWTVTSGSLSFPITLGASLDALPAELPTGQLGTGWSISANGSITRELRSLPDDYLDDVASPKRYGWLRNSTASMIGNFIPQADDDYSVVTDEAADYSFLSGLGGFSQGANMYDTEPDLFHIHVPGFGGTFLFDNSGQIQFLDQRNIKVDVQYDAGNEIIGFTITDESGVIYKFADPTKFTIETKAVAPTITHFTGTFNLYKIRGTKKVSYNSNWKLFSIENASGDMILFSKAPVSSLSGITPFPADIRQMDVDDVYVETHGGEKKLLYTIEFSWSEPSKLRSVIGEQTVEFFYNIYNITAGQYDFVQEILNTVKVRNTRGENKLLRQFDLGYRKVSAADPAAFTHLFLESIVERTTSGSLPPISFAYHGLIGGSTGTDILRGDRNTTLRDEFGFHATSVCCDEPYKTHLYPSLPNAERIRNAPVPNYIGNYATIGSAAFAPDLSVLTVGLLKQVNTALGGSYRLYYEPIDYYNATAQRNEYGAGVRVNRIAYHDGVDKNHDFEKTFNYKMEDNTTSSGVLIEKPVRAFTLPYRETSATGLKTFYPGLVSEGLSPAEIFKQMLVYSYLPLNDVGMLVGYKRVTESVALKGKTVYEFDIPAGYGVISEADWTATKTRIARYYVPSSQNVTPSDLGGTVGDYYAYPFAPNPNYGLKRGLLKKVLVYNNSGTLLTQTENTYTNASPTKIYALAIDKYSAQITSTLNGSTSTNEFPMFLYSRYEINTGAHALLASATRKNFDRNSSTLNVAETVTYQYSPGRAQPSKVITTGSDGAEHAVSIKYPADYSITTDFSLQDNVTKAITKLKEKNILTVEVEKISTRKESGGSELVKGSALSLFNYNATTDKIELVKALSFAPANPTSAFVASSVQNGANSVFIFDQSKYTQFIDLSNPTKRGQPQSFVDYARNRSGTLLTEGGLPLAVISNATVDEVVYDDFQYRLTEGAAGSEVPGRTYGTGRALNGGPEATFFWTFNRNADVVGTFSCWVKAGGPGTLTVRLTDGTNTATGTITVKNTANTWEYYSTSLNVGSLGNAVSLELESSIAISVDDALYIPASAHITLTCYGPNRLVMSQTNENGLATIYEYDDFDRLLYVRDQDNHILKANTYNFLGQDLPVLTIVGATKDEAYVNQNLVFKNIGWGSSDPNAICKWKIVSRSLYLSDPSVIDDFTVSTQTTTGNSYTHLSSSAVSYVVNLQVTSQGTTKTIAMPLTFQAIHAGSGVGLSVSICSNKGSRIDLCTSTSTSCPGGLGSSNLVLTATAVHGSGNYSYKWIVLNHPTASVPAGTSATFEFPDYCSGDYIYRCIVEDLDNGGMVYNDFASDTFKSNPSCGSTCDN